VAWPYPHQKLCEKALEGMNSITTNFNDGNQVHDALNVAGESILLEAIDRLPVGVGVEKPNGALTHCNQAFAAYYRVPARLLIGMDFMDRMGIICPQIVEVNGQPVIGTGPLAAFHTDPCMRHDAPGTIETRLRDGRSYLNERADLSNGGRVIVMTDVTALKRAEVEARAFSSLHSRLSTSPEARAIAGGAPGRKAAPTSVPAGSTWHRPGSTVRMDKRSQLRRWNFRFCVFLRKIAGVF
jgi:hypothetical protein